MAMPIHKEKSLKHIYRNEMKDFFKFVLDTERAKW